MWSSALKAMPAPLHSLNHDSQKQTVTLQRKSFVSSWKVSEEETGGLTKVLMKPKRRHVTTLMKTVPMPLFAGHGSFLNLSLNRPSGALVPNAFSGTGSHNTLRVNHMDT